MNQNNQTPSINLKFLILLLAINSFGRGFIQVYLKSNDFLRAKIMIIWLLSKLLVILINVRYIRKHVHKLTHNQEVSTGFWAVFRNTHLVSCICTFVSFLLMKI